MAGLYDTDLGSLKEPDVEKLIVLANADNFPLTTLCGTSNKAIQNRFSWAARMLPNVAVKAYADGEDQTEFATEQPDLLTGYTQEIRAAFKLGQQAEVTKTYTDHNTETKQKMWALERLYRATERAISSQQEQAAQTSTGAGIAPTVGSKLRGIFTALSPYAATGDAQTVDVFPTAYRTQAGAYLTPATLDALTEDDFEGMLTTIAEYTGEEIDLVGLCGPRLKAHLSKFVKKDPQASGTYNVSIRKYGDMWDVNYVVDVFKFDAGVVRTSTSYQLCYDLETGEATDQTKCAGVFVNPALLHMRKQMPLTYKELPDLGGGKSGLYAHMLGLQVDVPCKMGAIVPVAL